MKKVKVKFLKDVKCPNCEGSGKIDIGAPEPYNYKVDCDRCNGTGILEIEIEYCPICGEELEWNDMEFGFDEETETMFRCLKNECDKPKRKIKPMELCEELPF